MFFVALVVISIGAPSLWVGICAAEVPGASPEEEVPVDPRSASLAGAWILDRERSDPPTKMVEALEVPWYARPLIRASTPKFEMIPAETGLVVESSGPGGERRQRIWADGVERSGEDRLDRSYRERSRWEGARRLVVDRWIDLPSGVVVHVGATWERQDGDLINRIRIRVGEESPFDLRRIFVPNEV